MRPIFSLIQVLQFIKSVLVASQRLRRFSTSLMALLGVITAALPVYAQLRPRFPTNTVPPPVGGGLVSPQAPVTLGNPIPFDPYALPSGVPGTGAPVLPPLTLPPGGTLPPTVVGPQYIPPRIGLPPPGGLPPLGANQLPLPPAANTAPVLPPTLGPSQPIAPAGPTAVFPNGLNWGNFGQNGVGSGQYQRLIQETGFDYTYLFGESGRDLQIHEVDIHTTMVLQNFAHSPNGLRITPGFIFDFLDGPHIPDVIPDPSGPDLPAQLYSAYLDAGWRPQLAPQFAADVSFRAGVYSDFNTVTWHSIRFTGHGLGVLQVTPTLAIKLGVEYLDRQRVKLLPAGGLLWTPNDKTIFDIYFPRPLLSQYWTAVGNADIWWHIGAEYGGGSWTIDRPDAPMVGVSERTDINDLRIFGGINWKGLNERTGYLEIGYVFDREIIFKVVPEESTNLDDTFMVGGGISF